MKKKVAFALCTALMLCSVSVAALAAEPMTDADMWYDLTLFDVEGDFFGKLEQGYSILSVSDLFHCTAWNATEYLADEQNRDKENSCWKGMQKYLSYCKKHGITRNYLVKKEGYAGIDAMKFYDKSAVAKFEKNRKTQDLCR